MELQTGDVVDIGWITGELWRGGVLADVSGKRCTVRLPSGWHVHPYIAELRRPANGKTKENCK